MGVEPTYTGATILCLNHLTTAAMKDVNSGAGEGYRTLATGLEGRGSTTELHPRYKWSGRQDLNPRPSDPKSDALPSCATPRTDKYDYTS